MLLVGGSVCGVRRSDHRHLLDHVVGFHSEVAKECIPFVCWRCKSAFASKVRLATHTNTGCKKKSKAEKKKRKASAESHDTDASKEKKHKEQQQEQKADATSCCGYDFSGRLWNFHRHRSTRHLEGHPFSHLIFTAHFTAGDAQYLCLWTGCEQRFRRWEKRKAHIERDHHCGDMKELQPVFVTRQNEVFIYAVRKGNRGQRTLFLFESVDFVEQTGTAM